MDRKDQKNRIESNRIERCVLENRRRGSASRGAEAYRVCGRKGWMLLIRNFIDLFCIRLKKYNIVVYTLGLGSASDRVRCGSNGEHKSKRTVRRRSQSRTRAGRHNLIADNVN